jgi:hypothetical protein
MSFLSIFTRSQIQSTSQKKVSLRCLTSAAESVILKFIKKSIERKRVTVDYDFDKLQPKPEELVITQINEKTLFFNS